MDDEHRNAGLERSQYELRASGIKADSRTPLRSGIHSRGYLPHVKREGASYFVTFRLADSLPKEVLMKFEAEKAQRLRRLNLMIKRGEKLDDSEEEIGRDFQRKLERYLDCGHGACHLRRPDIATLVAKALKFFHDQRYLLKEWVIMPNHVHALLWPMPNHLLSDILKSWKQYSSRRAKPILQFQRDDDFWQRESYNHWLRDDDDESRIRRYIRNNPVTPGCVHNPRTGVGAAHRHTPHGCIELLCRFAFDPCRFGNRRYGRFGNLRYSFSFATSTSARYIPISHENDPFHFMRPGGFATEHNSSPR